MPLAPNQHVLHAIGHGTENALRQLDEQLKNLPVVRIVAMNTVITDVNVLGTSVQMSTIVAVAEEV